MEWSVRFQTNYQSNNEKLQCKIPKEWKIGIGSTIYKNKGSTEDVNNYRDNSVIPSIPKLFENILAEQIIEYFNKHKLLFSGQQGFRTDHSCKTSLHEIISDMNQMIEMIEMKEIIAMNEMRRRNYEFHLVNSCY